jgi:predicted amidohydrolase YtcJ
MLADLVLLDRDITADGVAIDQARIVATVLGGRVVYLAPAAVPEASR